MFDATMARDYGCWIYHRVFWGDNVSHMIPVQVILGTRPDHGLQSCRSPCIKQLCFLSLALVTKVTVTRLSRLEW